ncbi:MAG: TonB-dependent receptor [Rubritepida sp.]|nr:TonB-dependent receptor [Rubritepida sp.]
MSRSLRNAVGALLPFLATPALAQTAPDPTSTTLPQMEVTGTLPAGSLTVPDVETQRREVEQAPAAVRFIPSEDLDNRTTLNLHDVLQDTPGVFVGTRYGAELRLSVRGSGIARAFHLRGIELLQDGIPMNMADGSGDFYQIDPLAARSVTVFPGGNALSLGGSTLGGAVNFTTPTARTAEAPNIVRLEAGSFGTIRGSLQLSRAFGNWDAAATASVLHSDGYRQHSRSQYEMFNGNVGYRVNDNVETRFYFGSYIVQQQLPGSLTLQQALRAPTMASAAALAGHQARDVWAERIANRTTVRTEYGQFDLDVWGLHKRLFHPIFQVIAQDGWNWGVAPRFTTEFQVAGLRNQIILGGRYFAGSNDADQYTNVLGSRGVQTLRSRQNAQNYEAYFENRLWMLPDLALVAGAKALRNERDYRDFGGGLAFSRGNVALGRTYEGVNPRLGLLWQATPTVQAFANVTRSMDVPDFSDLTQTQANGVTGFVPLQAQRAWTTEIGTRGSAGRFGWDLTLFNSVLRGQLLQFTTDPSVPAATFNAGTTVNRGVEFAGRVDLAQNALMAEDRLRFTQVWTFNDFHFRNDRQYGSNRVAGLPPHVLRSLLRYSGPFGESREGFWVQPSLDWVPQGAWVDYANTQRAPSYLKLNLEAGVQVRPGLTVFLDARNLTNKRYISDLGTVTDARVATTAVYYPGDGRSFFAGARMAF